MSTETVIVLGAAHIPECLVARHPDLATWETSGFPWCTCPREFRVSRDAETSAPRAGEKE